MVKRIIFALFFFVFSMYIYTKQLETYYINQQYGLIYKSENVEWVLSEITETDIENGRMLVSQTKYSELVEATLAKPFTFKMIPYCFAIISLGLIFIIFWKHHDIKLKQDFMYQIELILNRHYQANDNSTAVNIKLNDLERYVSKLEGENQKSKERMKVFIEDVAHQIKSPLTSLKLYVDLEDNQKMAIQVQRIETIVTKLIHLGRLEAHAVKFNFEMNNLQQIINDALTHLDDIIMKKELVIHNNSQSVLVYCDYFWLQESIFNLLNNATEYSFHGGDITIETKLMDEQVLIEINDEGKGINSEDAKHIFDRFYTNNKDRKETTHMGIGLNISKEVVLSHHGQIYAIPKKEGMRFIIKLPIPMGKEKI